MNSNVFITKDYVKNVTGYLVKTKPNKANRRPLAENPKHYVLNPK